MLHAMTIHKRHFNVSYSEFDEILRIRREVDKKIKEVNSAVQVHQSLLG